MNPDPEEKEKSGGEASEKKSLKKKFYESKPYAKHVARVVQRNQFKAKKVKEKIQKKKERAGKRAMAASKRSQKIENIKGNVEKATQGVKKKVKDTAKSVKAYFKGSKQRRANRQAERSNAGVGGGGGCVEGQCSAPPKKRFRN